MSDTKDVEMKRRRRQYYSNKEAKFTRRLVMLTGLATVATTTLAFTLLPAPKGARGGKFPPRGHHVDLSFKIYYPPVKQA